MRVSNFLVITIFFLTASVFAEDSEIKIGYVTALSGDNAFFGEQEVAAATLAVEDLKEEGINARVIFEDSQTNPQAGLSAVMKLLNSDQVDAFFVSFSPVVNATIGAIQGANKLLVYSAAARSPLTKHQYAFKTYLDYIDGCSLLAERLKSKGKKFTYFKPEIESGELCEKGIQLQTKDYVTNVFPKDYVPKTEIFKSKKADSAAIITAGYPQGVITIVQAAKAISYRPIIGESDYVFNAQILSDFGAELEGSMAFGMHAVRSKAYDERHLNLLKNKTVGVNSYAGVDYLHIKQIARAVKNCPKDDTSCQAEHIAKSAPEPDWGFLGWQDRVAKINLHLKVVKGGKLVEEK